MKTSLLEKLRDTNANLRTEEMVGNTPEYWTLDLAAFEIFGDF